MTKKIEDYSFQEFMNLIKNYVDTAKSGTDAELFIFKQENPIIDEKEFEVFLDEFLKSFGVTEELLKNLGSLRFSEDFVNKKELIH